MVKGEHGGQHSMAERSKAPAPGAGDFGNEPAEVETLEKSRDGGAGRGCESE